MRKKQQAAQQHPERLVALEVPSVASSELRDDTKNARTIEEREIVALGRSMLEFGFLQPVVARAGDGLIIGGHQRRRAYVEKAFPVLATVVACLCKLGGRKALGMDAPRVPIVWVELDDARARMLNLALNRIGGEWEHERLASLIGELNQSVSLEELAVTGFSPAELTDYADLMANPANLFGQGGEVPGQTKKAPSLNLDFSTAKKRDAVKKAIAAKTEDGKLSGDVLAKLLGIR